MDLHILNARSGWPGISYFYPQLRLSSFRVNIKRTLATPIGKYRLDWIFVKANLRHPHQHQDSYRLARHKGRALNRLKYFLLIEPISDHDQILSISRSRNR